MEREHDATYYLRRAEEERELARNAADPAAAHIHTELAESYMAKAQAAQSSIITSTS
jgi:hypothetical protein